MQITSKVFLWFKLLFMNLLKIICFLLIFGTINSGAVKAQTNSWQSRLCLEGNYHYGFLMPHTDFISFFVKSHIQSFQLNVGLFANGEKSWHRSYNYPTLGIGYHYSNLGNNIIYGKMNALFAYVDRYYLNLNRKFNFGNRLSLGAAFINKRFDLEENPTNLAIGSKLNAYLNYSFETTHRIFPRTELKLGAGVTHVSNGSFRQPNKGLNFFTVFSGLTYNFYGTKAIVSNQFVNDSSRNQFIVQGVFGNKQISRKSSSSYLVGGLSAEYAHVITGNSWGGVVLSFYHDPSLPREMSQTDTTQTTASDKIRVTLNISYELKMGRVSYVFQPGVYLKNPYKVSGDISNRFMVRYQISNQVLASFAIKAHWFAVADFFEWGIGYRWKK